jgi:MFS family permease
LNREILAPAVAVVLGAIMTILDATIVNVAVPTLGRDLHTSISTIQWVPTVYLLAFASVIPFTGWAAGRFGAKPVWLASVGLFMVGLLLAGLSPSIGALIGFRAVQGLGGGMIMPLGQLILAEAAGPKRMGRVMSIVGVPMLLAPIFGPLIGGFLIDAASWRWIFFVNLPVGLLAIALAVRLLPAAATRSAQRLDVIGAVLLSGGLALFLYGLAETGQHARWMAPAALGPMAAGAVLVALFVRHARRVPDPLIDLRLFRHRGFAAGTAANFVLGTALFAVALLLPLYFQILRGRSPLQTGLLLAPQGPRRGHHHQPGRLPDRQGRRPPGRPGRGFPRHSRHRLVHPDRRAHPVLGPAGCAVPGRRRPWRHHHPGHGGRLPGPAACRHGPSHQRHQRRAAGRGRAWLRPARRRAPAGDGRPAARLPWRNRRGPRARRRLPARRGRFGPGVRGQLRRHPGHRRARPDPLRPIARPPRRPPARHLTNT